MNSLRYILSIISFLLSTWGYANKEIDSLLNVLDHDISNYSIYEKNKKERVENLKSTTVAPNSIDRYALNFSIYNEYKTQLNKIWTKENYKEKVIQHNEFNTFADIFTVKDWDKYLRILTECTPRLLEYDEMGNAYKFIGNKKKEKGCIAQYFKQLKAKGIINNNINRDELAKVLSNCLIDYKISGSSIDNESEQYKKIYERQLFN